MVSYTLGDPKKFLHPESYIGQGIVAPTEEEDM